MDIGPTELIIILIIIIVLFGVGRIGKLGGELGSGIRAFREGLRGKDNEDKKASPAPAAAQTKGEFLPPPTASEPPLGENPVPSPSDAGRSRARS